MENGSRLTDKKTNEITPRRTRSARRLAFFSLLRDLRDLRGGKEAIASGTLALESPSCVITHPDAIEHRIAPNREAGLQTGEGLCEDGEDQKSRSISADVSRIDPAAGKILDARSE